jgi:DNA-binding response OmpR family regulator
MKRFDRVLIVDDDWKNADILVRLLRDEYTLKTAATGEECLTELVDFRPHLVLLDIMMPGISGHETCRRIRFSPLSDSVRIILVSAKETIADHARGSDALADDYVIKPFDHAEMLSKVRAQFDAMNMEANLKATTGIGLVDKDKPISEQQQARLAAALQKLAGTHEHQRHPIA